MKTDSATVENPAREAFSPFKISTIINSPQWHDENMDCTVNGEELYKLAENPDFVEERTLAILLNEVDGYNDMTDFYKSRFRKQTCLARGFVSTEEFDDILELHTKYFKTEDDTKARPSNNHPDLRPATMLAMEMQQQKIPVHPNGLLLHLVTDLRIPGGNLLPPTDHHYSEKIRQLPAYRWFTFLKTSFPIKERRSFRAMEGVSKIRGIFSRTADSLVIICLANSDPNNGCFAEFMAFLSEQCEKNKLSLTFCNLSENERLAKRLKAEGFTKQLQYSKMDVVGLVGDALTLEAPEYHKPLGTNWKTSGSPLKVAK